MADKDVKKSGKHTHQQRKGVILDSFMTDGGEMGAFIRSYDWSHTIMGEPSTWPNSLRTALGIILNSSFPMFIWWGKKDLTNFYNDAYKTILGNKHPSALGSPAAEIWAEVWDSLEPFAHKVFKTGKPVFMKNLRLTLNRHGYDEETYFTFSYSPLRNEKGTVEGIFCAVTETTDEVLSRQLLEESEKRFRNLADTAPTFIAMADKLGNAVYFNKPWLEYTGKTLEELRGQGWLSTLHPEDAPKLEKDYKRAFSLREPIKKEYRFKRADGEYRWMLAVGAPRFTPDGHFSGYFGTFTDFHDLKQAQLAVQHSEDRFRTLIDKSADAIQMVSAEGKIIFSSDSIKNVLGYTPQELANTGITPYLHPDDMDYFFSNFYDLIKHPGKQITMQYRVKHKNGTWAWLETVGVNHLNTPNIHALVGNFRNITKQKEAEDKLRSSEERFRALAENIPNLAWMADPTGAIYWYNNRWYEYTGTKAEQMEGWGWQSVHDPKYLPRVLKEWKQSVRSGRPFEMVFPLRGADGIFRPFLTRVVPLFNEDGSINQWIGTNTDISEQLKIKQAEARNEELESITKQLALQRKDLLSLNKTKDEFIGMASHQLRTPATAVKQYISLLMDGVFGPVTKDQHKYLEIAYDSNERELRIINDLLKTAQMDSTEYKLNQEPHDIVQLIRDAILHVKPAMELQQQEISLIAPDGPITLMVDATEIKLVLVNLLENAIKYSRTGTLIKVSVKKSDKHVEIIVADHGVGISKDDQVRVFEKFTRVDNDLSDTVTGTGLGLYWVKQLIELHHGSVKLSSEKGKGSKFKIRLPL